ILRGAHGRRKRFAGLAGFGLVAFGPGDRHHRLVLLAGDRFVSRRHAFQHLAHYQRLAIAGQRQAGAADVRLSPDIAVLDAADDRVAFLALGDDAARALLAVLAVMADPGFTQHLPAKTTVPSLVVVGVLDVGLAVFDVEGMGRGP